MPDICIFYSEPDENKVEVLSSILEGFGWSVWWDKEIKNGRWGPEIERNIKTARCVIPIWNYRAVRDTSITYVEAETSIKLKKPLNICKCWLKERWFSYNKRESFGTRNLHQILRICFNKPVCQTNLTHFTYTKCPELF